MMSSASFSMPGSQAREGERRKQNPATSKGTFAILAKVCAWPSRSQEVSGVLSGKSAGGDQAAARRLIRSFIAHLSLLCGVAAAL